MGRPAGGASPGRLTLLPWSSARLWKPIDWPWTQRFKRWKSPGQRKSSVIVGTGCTTKPLLPLRVQTDSCRWWMKMKEVTLSIHSADRSSQVRFWARETLTPTWRWVSPSLWSLNDPLALVRKNIPPTTPSFPIATTDIIPLTPPSCPASD